MLVALLLLQVVFDFPEKSKSDMPKTLCTKAAFLTFAVAAVGFSFAPVAEATPVNYDFSVQVITDPSLSADGTFSFDSSSITPGSTNTATGLLTALDFTFNGITYDANTANTGFLSFDADGKLTNILFGTNCDTVKTCSLPWFARSGKFTYGRPGTGRVTFSLAPVAVPVPEPGALGLFGLGALLIGLFVGVRRRIF